MKESFERIMSEMTDVLDRMEGKELQALCEHIGSASAVFVTGEGRTGLMAKAFAMRLMHAGKRVYVVGETITPSIQQGDTLLAVSGTGETETVYLHANQARQKGASVIAMTTNPQSKIALISDQVVTIPAATKLRREGEPRTSQPLGNQFDQCLHIVLDAVAMETARSSNIRHEDMAERHASLQ